MKLTKREFKLVILAVLIIGGGSIFKWGIKPLIKNQRILDEKLVAKERQWANKKRLLQESERYKKALQQAQGEVKELESLTFTENINAAQLKGLNILANQIEGSGLKVKNKGLRVESKDDNNYDVLYYDFSLVGSFNALTNFLKGLNSTKKLFMVEKLQLRKVEQNSQLEIKLLIKTIKQ